MAQQSLKLVNGQALLQDMGGIRMAQTVDAPIRSTSARRLAWVKAFCGALECSA